MTGTLDRLVAKSGFCACLSGFSSGSVFGRPDPRDQKRLLSGSLLSLSYRRVILAD